MEQVHHHKTRPSRHFDSLEQEVFLSIWRTYDRLRLMEDELFSTYDLSPQQYNVLRLLNSVKPQSMHTLELASRLVSRAPDITRMLNKLEQRALIVRERPVDNRRVVLVAITTQGCELLEKMYKPICECHALQLGHLTTEQLKALIVLLREARLPHEKELSEWI